MSNPNYHPHKITRKEQRGLDLLYGPAMSPIRFVRVPTHCVHRVAWASPCGQCNALAEKGLEAVPKDVMGIMTVVERPATQPRLLPD